MIDRLDWFSYFASDLANKVSYLDAPWITFIAPGWPQDKQTSGKHQASCSSLAILWFAPASDAAYKIGVSLQLTWANIKIAAYLGQLTIRPFVAID